MKAGIAALAESVPERRQARALAAAIGAAPSAENAALLARMVPQKRRLALRVMPLSRLVWPRDPVTLRVAGLTRQMVRLKREAGWLLDTSAAWLKSGRRK